MNRTEIIQRAQQAGFTHVWTCGGPVPLQDWQPYGIGRYRPESSSTVKFYLEGTDILERSLWSGVSEAGLVRGVWPLM